MSSGPARSLRAAPPTISAPPLNSTGAGSPSRRNTYETCSGECPGVARTSTSMSSSSNRSPGVTGVCGNDTPASAGSYSSAPVSARRSRAPDTKSAWRWVSKTADDLEAPVPRPRPGSGGCADRDRPGPHGRDPPRTRYEPLPSPASWKSCISIPTRLAAGDQDDPVTAAAFLRSSSWRTRRRTLPINVSGSSSRNSHSFGTR